MGYFAAPPSTTITQALSRGQFMPMPGVFATQSGYTANSIYLMDEAAHADGLRDSVSANHLAAAGGVSLYRRWKSGYRGVYVPSASYSWELAAVHAPGAASMAVVGAFSMAAHAAADIALWGYADTGGGLTRLYARVLTASDKVAITVVDPVAAHSGTVTIEHAITFGAIYCLAYHINRTTGFLYTRLVNVTTGVGYNGTPLDISAFNAITGASTPKFQIGAMTTLQNGTDVSHLGVAVITSGITGADVVSNLTQRLANA